MSRATSSAPSKRTTISTGSLTVYLSATVWIAVSFMPFFTETTNSGLMKIGLSSVVNLTRFMLLLRKAMTPAPNPLTSVA